MVTVSKKTLLVILVVSLLSLPLIYAASTEPNFPDSLTRLRDEIFNTSLHSSQSVYATAGNVTELSMFARGMTQSWQGFYGNITGTIELSDGQGNIFYNWTAAEPQGRVYASNSSTINWSGVKCFNYTANYTDEINMSIIEAQFNISDQAPDGINESFGTGSLPDGSAYSTDGGINHPAFTVGTVQIVAGTCPATTTHEQGGRLGLHFIEVILTDKWSPIWTTIIENRTPSQFEDINGFDNEPHDFQLMVPEDGHGGNIASTLYYFWVELE